MFKQNKTFQKMLLCLLLLNGVSNASDLTKEQVYDMNKVVAYFPGWGIYNGHENYYVSKIPFDKLTHINMAFVEVSDTGELTPGEPGPDLLQLFGEPEGSEYLGNYGQLRKFRKDHSNVSLMLSLGGWTLSGKFSAIAKNETKRQKFATNIALYVHEHRFDGIDIDWEFPGVQRNPDKIDCSRDQGNPVDVNDKDNFILLLKDVRAALDKQGEVDNKYYQLTIAVGSALKHIKDSKPQEYAEYVDFINIMTYDMHGAWETRTNHQSPLFKNDKLPDDGLTVNQSVQRFLKLGVDSRKLLIGIPAYTRGWKGVDCSTSARPFTDQNKTPGLGCKASGAANGSWDGGRSAGTHPFKYIVDNKYVIVNRTAKTKIIQSLNENGFVSYRDELTKTPYLYSTKLKEFYTYEDVESLDKKLDYVEDHKLAGVFLWELSEDSENINTSLLKKMHDRVLPHNASDGDKRTEQQKKDADTSDAKRRQLKREKYKNAKAKDDGDDSAKLSAECEEGTVYHKDDIVIIADHYYIAKWWINNCTPSADAWLKQGEVKVHDGKVVSKEDQEKIIKEADKIAKKLIEGKKVDESGKESNATKVARDIAKKSNKKEENLAPVNDDPLTAQQIKEIAESELQCHTQQIYYNGDICKYNGKLYKFKWWTKFANNTDLDSIIELTDEEEKKTPALKLNSIPAKNISYWSPSKIYAKAGRKVKYDNFVYESKWWTKGDKPSRTNSETPWKKLGIVNNSLNADFNATAEQNVTKETLKKVVLKEGDEPIVGDDGSIATFDGDKNETVVTGGKEDLAQNIDDGKNFTSGEKFFMPFVDMTLWPPYDPSDAIEAGVKNFVLAFVNSADGVCAPKWGGFAQYGLLDKTIKIAERFKKINDANGVVSISFGGAGAGLSQLATACKTKEELAKAYNEVIDTLKVKRIDFDIEGLNISDNTSIMRRLEALQIVKVTHPNINISFTLPILPTGLLENAGVLVKKAIKMGVIDIINVMLMDYGYSYPANENGAHKMAAYSIQAIESLNTQIKAYIGSDDDLKAKFSSQDDGNYYNRIGVTPMIGQNDITNEIFYIAGIRKFTQWCNQKGVIMTSEWSLNRDKVKTGWSLFESTKLEEKDYGTNTFEFSRILNDREDKGEK
jgi:chitinase